MGDAQPRMLVAEKDGHRWAFPMDEIYGVQTVQPGDVTETPVTVSKTAASYTQGLLEWMDLKVGLLDADLLFPALNRSLL